MTYELSNDFAMKLINKELELEANCNIYCLRELIELYRFAIEYFEEAKDPKFLDFQVRLQKILMRPVVLQLMQEESASEKTTDKASLRTYRRRHTANEKPSVFFTHPLEIPNVDIEETGLQEDKTPKTINRIVETQQSRTKKGTNRVVFDLKSQDISLQDRLRSRKQKLLNVSTDSSYMSFMSKDLNSSYSVGKYSNARTLDSLETIFDSEFYKQNDTLEGSLERSDIEKIIEKNYLEKTEKVTEIKIRYESQIGEVEGMGAISEVIIENLKKKMQEEIDLVSQKLDQERKTLICQAKML